LGADFYAFSAHKMLGPTGVGVLWGKEELLEEMDPFLAGGEMISEVSFKGASWNSLPWKFEAGTPNIADVIAFKEALFYLQRVGMDNIIAWEKELTSYALEKLNLIADLKIYGPQDLNDRLGVISFNLGKIHAHDLATILDNDGICIRSGQHCAQPLMGRLGINSAARASFYLYNTKTEVDKLILAVKKAREIFAKK
jgi:cysteine desulfurase/selenocysteine lyase